MDVGLKKEERIGEERRKEKEKRKAELSECQGSAHWAGNLVDSSMLCNIG